MNIKLSDIDFYNKTAKLYTLKRKSKNIVRVLTISDSLLNMVLMYQKKIDLKNTDHIFTKKPNGKPITVQAVLQSGKILDLMIHILGG